MIDKLREDLSQNDITKHAATAFLKAQEDQVLRNVYRQYYDIPNELNMGIRKADDYMRVVVQESETLNKVRKLYTNTGMHPSLIFFSDSLHEN